MSRHIAVVGGSLAGLRSAEQLRALGHTGTITVFSAERHFPYNRPPLSKEALAQPDSDLPAELATRLAFRRRTSLADVDFRFRTPVVAADLAAHTVTVDSGATVSYDGLVVATGLRPRRLTVPGPERGRHVLRTVEDCLGLRHALRPESRVVVVGAGFIGCEVAGTLTSLGHQVTVVEPAGAPMQRVLGVDVATAVQRHHSTNGIQFLTGTGVTAFTGDGKVTGVVLDTGTTLAADLVVEAVGSVCNVEWLDRNGLDLSDGVLTDNELAVIGAADVVAVGDIARFPNPLFDDVPRRVEHWSIPTDTARRAAATLVRGPGDGTPFSPVPAFWSDQRDLRLQSYGSPALADEIRIEEGDLDDLTAGVVATYHHDNRHIGTVAVNLSPARCRALREAFVAADVTA
ncbi:NAD(P)/FAD-dependent oxidoreductase [Mycobacterium aquaticum]|uniref:Ferredoxin reductase n=1 Tax=Mycobacterium aquaticum TaxID=1927124 RepID=A0A1X0B1U0_9MYCO|nr:FAD-dependent oxidoreductase [Mycobacterium aquaticum]ORA36277.1 ferredoxin reductase [Mycobacterium aquaticum]